MVEPTADDGTAAPTGALTGPRRELSVVPLEVDVQVDPACTVVALRGELDLATVGALRSRLAPVVADGPRRLVVDVGGLSFVDATGLQGLVDAARALSASGGTVALHRPSRMLRRMLPLLGFDALLPVEA